MARWLGGSLTMSAMPERRFHRALALIPAALTASVIARRQRRRGDPWRHRTPRAYPLLMESLPDLGLFVIKLGQSLQQSFRYRLGQDIGAQPRQLPVDAPHLGDLA